MAIAAMIAMPVRLSSCPFIARQNIVLPFVTPYCELGGCSAEQDNG